MRKISRKGLVKKLDTIFSLYIRLRKANKEGVAECYTCGIKKHFKELQCGHFQSRKHYATRWREDNCQVQCYSCNVMRYGEQFKFGLKLEKEYGYAHPEILMNLSKTTVKFSNDDLNDMIEKYKKLVEIRKKELSL